jgi:hypothetical protein
LRGMLLTRVEEDDADSTDNSKYDTTSDYDSDNEESKSRLLAKPTLTATKKGNRATKVTTRFHPGSNRRKRNNHNHTPYPQFPLGTLVVQVTNAGSEERQGTIGQILQVQECLSKFLYIVCWLDASQEVTEQDLLEGLDQNILWFQLNNNYKKRDMYLAPSKKKEFARMLRSIPSYGPTVSIRRARNQEIMEFGTCYSNKAFKLSQRLLLFELKTALLGYVDTLGPQDRPDRLDWLLGVKAQKGHPNFLWQLLHLLVSSSVQNDAQLLRAFAEVFQMYDDPFVFATSPATVYAYLTAEHGGADKRLNFCFKKAKYTIYNAKLAILRKYCSSKGVDLEKKVGELADCMVWDKGFETPLPYDIIQAVPRSESLFPESFDKEFFMGFKGVSHKVAHLLSEAGYGVITASTGI